MIDGNVRYKEEEELDCGVVIVKEWYYKLTMEQASVDVKIDGQSGMGTRKVNVPLDESPPEFRQKVASMLCDVRSELDEVEKMMGGHE